MKLIFSKSRVMKISRNYDVLNVSIANGNIVNSAQHLKYLVSHINNKVDLTVLTFYCRFLVLERLPSTYGTKNQ